MLDSIFTIILKFRRENATLAHNCCNGIQFQKMAQTSRMVTMPMREYQIVYFPQVDVKQTGIANEQIRCTCIKE